MKTPRGKAVPLSIGILGIAVLVTAGLTFLPVKDRVSLPRPPDGFYPNRVASRGMSAIVQAKLPGINTLSRELKDKRLIEIETGSCWILAGSRKVA